MRGAAKRIRELFKLVKAWPVGRYKELGEAASVDRQSARDTVRDFLRRGELVVDDGMYRYLGRPERRVVADKIWRAWRYCPQWTVNEIAQLAEADRETVKSYVRLYRMAGYVERIGKRKREDGVIEGVYRLKNRHMRKRPCISKKTLGKNS